MSGQVTSSFRATALVLLLGSLASAICFVIGIALRFGAAVESATALSNIGVLVLLATPALGLAASAIELRRSQRQAAALAVAVLAVLGVAVAVALLAR